MNTIWKHRIFLMRIKPHMFVVESIVFSLLYRLSDLPKNFNKKRKKLCTFLESKVIKI